MHARRWRRFFGGGGTVREEGKTRSRVQAGLPRSHQLTTTTVGAPAGREFVLNDQVQGGAKSYRHNFMLLAEHGFKPHPVAMRIAFGVGDRQWTNHAPSQVTERCALRSS